MLKNCDILCLTNVTEQSNDYFTLKIKEHTIHLTHFKKSYENDKFLFKFNTLEVFKNKLSNKEIVKQFKNELLEILSIIDCEKLLWYKKTKLHNNTIRPKHHQRLCNVLINKRIVKKPKIGKVWFINKSYKKEIINLLKAILMIIKKTLAQDYHLTHKNTFEYAIADNFSESHRKDNYTDRKIDAIVNDSLKKIKILNESINSLKAEQIDPKNHTFNEIFKEYLDYIIDEQHREFQQVFVNTNRNSHCIHMREKDQEIEHLIRRIKESL